MQNHDFGLIERLHALGLRQQYFVRGKWWERHPMLAALAWVAVTTAVLVLIAPYTVGGKR